mmetsp:Transcript_58422/g.107851  ORF Transcript_58422/g.107851 Transcript_58422/m.107851 type:complete len:86 (-) Transcript_58422:709-966(-)
MTWTKPCSVNHLTTDAPLQSLDLALVMDYAEVTQHQDQEHIEWRRLRKTILQQAAEGLLPHSAAPEAIAYHKMGSRRALVLHSTM